MTKKWLEVVKNLYYFGAINFEYRPRIETSTAAACTHFKLISQWEIKSTESFHKWNGIHFWFAWHTWHNLQLLLIMLRLITLSVNMIGEVIKFTFTFFFLFHHLRRFKRKIRKLTKYSIEFITHFSSIYLPQKF